jgi:cobalt-zinc-cadmium efflux system membrane fusion protein
MKNSSSCFAPWRKASAKVGAALALAALVIVNGCSTKTDDSAQATPASAVASDVTLSAAQRQHIRLYTVASSDYRRAIETTGTVDFDNDQATSVLAPFSGPVARLLVSPGDKVIKGQSLALVDSPDFAAAISAYSKALVTARNARRLSDADKDLVQHDGVARREAQQAETDAANADADRDAALQSLLALGVDRQVIKAIEQGRPLARMQAAIRAPIAGTVVEKLITPGQLLQTGTTACFTVANLSRVWVMAQLSDDDLASVGVGDPADIITGTGSKNLAGTVANVAALVNPDTRLVSARVVVDNPGDVLKKQMYVSVVIHSRQQSRGILIPVSAILRDDENLPFVYVAQRDGSFARRHVTLGYRSGNSDDVVAGLTAGERIVVDGGIFVQFMQSQ